MNAIVKTNKKAGFEYAKIDKPAPGTDEVLIEVEAAAICGTDIHYYEWNQVAEDFAAKFNIKFPFVVGHEFAGKIVAVGKNVKTKNIGDRVSVETHIPCGRCFQCQYGNPHNCINMNIYGTSCNGCFGEYALAPEKVVFTIPDKVSYEEGALFEPAGVAMRAVEEINAAPGETIVVYGCGPIALIAIQMLQVCGAARVIALDIDEYRLNLAEKYGAITINPSKEDAISAVTRLTKGRGGADAIIELTGVHKAYESLFEMLRLEGRVATVGHPSGEIPINITQNINLKGASIKGVFGRRIWETWWNLTELMNSKKINILDVVTHRFAFSQHLEAFEQIKKGAGKVLFVKNKQD